MASSRDDSAFRSRLQFCRDCVGLGEPADGHCGGSSKPSLDNDHGLWPCDKRDVPVPANPRIIEEDETQLGFFLPRLLKQLYSAIGNGGFGPGYGLTGLTGGMADDTGSTAPTTYLSFRSDAELGWPVGLLPICHWGCAIRSCIDCNDPYFGMRIFDPNVCERYGDWSDSFFDDAITFDAWIEAWASGSDLWKRAYGRGGTVTAKLMARRPKDPWDMIPNS